MLKTTGDNFPPLMRSRKPAMFLLLVLFNTPPMLLWLGDAKRPMLQYTPTSTVSLCCATA